MNNIYIYRHRGLSAVTNTWIVYTQHLKEVENNWDDLVNFRVDYSHVGYYLLRAIFHGAGLSFDLGG